MWCKIFKFILFYELLICAIFGDVLHLNKLYNFYDLQSPYYGGGGGSYNYENYEQQNQHNQIPNNEPFIPEIIVNRAAAVAPPPIIPLSNPMDSSSQGYNYYNNVGYLPPTTLTTTTSAPIISQSDTMFNRPQSDDINNSYLPPYPPFFDEPSTTVTTTSTTTTTQPTIVYLPPQTKNNFHVSFHYDDETNAGKKLTNNGYNYLPPIASATTTTTTTPQIPFIQQSDELLPPFGDNHQIGYAYNKPASTNIKSISPQFTNAQNTNNNNIIILKDHIGRDIQLNPLKLQINELRCLPQPNGYFKILLTIQSSLENLPIVDNTDYQQQQQQQQQDRKCDFQILKSILQQQQLLFYVTSEDFQRCGIEKCANNNNNAGGSGGVNQENFCLRIRFPQIRGMKTFTDSLLTFQCKAQERIVSKTHSLRFALTDINKGRTMGTYVKGGHQQPFRTNMALYRQDINGFTRNLEPGGIVQLGEELMLKIHTKPGDGWNHTRLSDINLQRLSKTGDVINSIQLIKSNGCINPLMRSICTTTPIFESPLGHRLGFRAVMFQGMKNGDEIVMSAKIMGCVDYRDCFELQSSDCEQFLNGRIRRNINSDFNQLYEVSKISFRVTAAATAATAPQSLNQTNFNNNTSYINQLKNIDNNNDNNERNVIGSIGIFTTLIFICSIALIGFYVKYKI